MGAPVQLKKKEKQIPAAQFCFKTGCAETPKVRLREAMTEVVYDFCNSHGNALRQWSPHAYVTLNFPKGNHTP